MARSNSKRNLKGFNGENKSKLRSTASHAGSYQPRSAGMKERGLPLNCAAMAMNPVERKKKLHPKRPSGGIRPSQLASTRVETQKRSRQEDDIDYGSNHRPFKKPRTSEQADQNTSVFKDPGTHEGKELMADTQPTTLRGTGESTLPAEIHHLAHKYDLLTTHIISSSKMEQKIRIVLERIDRYTPADTASKPTVIILYADAAVANKMISIIEIAKKEMEKAKGKWYQYSKLESRIVESKADHKYKPNGLKLKQCDLKAKDLSMGKAVRDGVELEASGSLEPREVMDSGSGAEEEEPFETMKAFQPIERVQNRVKLRSIPVMTIYLARFPLPGLKDIHG